MSSISLAFVDSTGTVTLNLNTDASLATSFTSSVHIIDTTDLNPQPSIGWTYDGINFIAPPVIITTDTTTIDTTTN